MKFIKSGMQTSIQDLGRIGLMNLGVSQGGAMDQDSLKLANWLVGNPTDAPAFEITLIGPVIEFQHSLLIAICGAQFELFLNQTPVDNNCCIKVSAGDQLRFGKLINGARAYLSISAHFQIPRVLSSYSTHLIAGFGGYKGRQIKDNDKLDITPRNCQIERVLPANWQRNYSGNYLIRCVNSVETELFSKDMSESFFSQSYQVSPQSNRMGIQLEGDFDSLSNSIEITSSGLTLGSIQITPSGKPIISTVDGQTIGGYPRIANVISSDLPLLGQLKASDRVNFTLIEYEYAVTILQNKEQFLQSIFSS